MYLSPSISIVLPTAGAIESRPSNAACDRLMPTTTAGQSIAAASPRLKRTSLGEDDHAFIFVVREVMAIRSACALFWLPLGVFVPVFTRVAEALSSEAELDVESLLKRGEAQDIGL